MPLGKARKVLDNVRPEEHSSYTIGLSFSKPNLLKNSQCDRSWIVVMIEIKFSFECRWLSLKLCQKMRL